jgi:hypothetical protein
MAISDKFYQRIRKVLVKHGVLDEAKAEEAAGIADRENRSYADVLLERDMDRRDGLPLGDLAGDEHPAGGRREGRRSTRTPSRSSTRKLATYYCVLPLSKIGNVLTLAVGNPSTSSSWTTCGR